MTRLGVYSVVRGAVDRDSFRMTRETLAKGGRKLVIFGEGEISHQNETIMPFESGIVQFGLWALNDMEKAGDLKPLYLVPVGIKYIYRNDMWDQIERGAYKFGTERPPRPCQPTCRPVRPCEERGRQPTGYTGERVSPASRRRGHTE